MRYSPAAACILFCIAACQQHASPVSDSVTSPLATLRTSAGDESQDHIDFDWNAVVDGLLAGEGVDGAPPASASTPHPAALVTHVIDFETPQIPFPAGRLVIDPYVDPVTGVSFTAVGTGAMVGLVRNNQTSACAEPADNDQKLGSGPADAIGLASYPLAAEFPAPLPGPVTVSVEVQALINTDVWLQLVGPDGSVTSNIQRALVPAGTCGFPGGHRSRLVISATHSAPVSHVIVRCVQPGRVFVLDDFTFEYTPVSLVLDVRPGSCRNPLNPASHGVLPVALLGTDDTSVADVDIASLRLAGVAPLRSHIDDVGGAGDDTECACPVDGADGRDDLVLHFRTQELIVALGGLQSGVAVPVEITGMLMNATPFSASDCVTVVGRDDPEAKLTGADR